MTTEYDKKRYALAEKLKSCVEDARELLDMNISGYENMYKEYATDVYKAILDAYHKV